jgi:streptogramin lyase
MTTGGAEIAETGLASDSGPTGIVAGSDNRMWVTETDNDRIAPVTLAGTAAAGTAVATGGGPLGIAAGSDSRLWSVESGLDQIAALTTGGVLTEFPVSPGAGVSDITAGPDGALWFTETDGNQIGRITTAGTITEFPLPTANVGPQDIAAGPDGNLWFTESSNDAVGRITPTGAVTEFPAAAGSTPQDITAGPDGRMWFTENGTNAIGRITLDAPGVATGAASQITQTTATLNGSVDPNAAATTYHFDYGLTPLYGSQTPGQSAGAGDAPVPEAAGIAGLTPGATYHFRVVATSPIGTSTGADNTFTAGSPNAPPPPPPPPAPSPTISAPTVSAATVANVGHTAATVTSTIAPGGARTTYLLQCRSAGKLTTAAQGALPTTDTAAPISARVTGLQPGARARCRFTAANSAGSASGAAVTFTTLPVLRIVLPRVIAGIAGRPTHLTFTTTMAARVTIQVLRDGRTIAHARASADPAVRAHRGTNHVVVPALSAGRYRLRVTAVAGSQRAARNAALRIALAPGASFTG